MKKTMLVTASALVLTLAAATTASAKDGFYMALRGGTTNFNVNNNQDGAPKSNREDFDNTWNISGALGYKYKYIRVEAEYIYRNDINDHYSWKMGDEVSTHKVELESDSFMINGYFDIMPNYWISPYIAGGVGMSRLDLHNQEDGVPTADSERKDTFSWMLGAGLSLRLNRCLNLDAGYRYIDMGDLGHAEFNVHEFYGGLRYTF